MNLRINDTLKDSIVDGPGLRYVLFVQGCLLRCPGCHNQKTHDLNGGSIVDTKYIIDDIRKSKLITGVTFSGGEPFLQPLPLIEIAEYVKSKNLNLIIYTGQYYNNLIEDETNLRLIKMADYLIDGPFDINKKSLNLKFKGSKNQRIIDVKKSLEKGKVVIATL